MAQAPSVGAQGRGNWAPFRELGLGPRLPSLVASLCALSFLSLLTAPQMLPQHRALPLDSSPNQFSLYTSPSLPNISLGLQATVTVTNSHLTVSIGHIPHLSSSVEVTGPACPQLGSSPSKALREIGWPYPELGGR